MKSVMAPAHAKLNLFLRVLAREHDGFHGIETLFCRLALADEVRAERRDGTAVTLDTAGVDLGPTDANLAVRAAEMVLGATGRRFGIHLTLIKRIPVRAGLGGGSSDAATALRLANRLAADAVPQHELLQFAARLGSDVPFLFTGSPLALAWGHGERLLNLPPLPRAAVLLLSPTIGVSSADAYQWVDAARHGAGRRGAVSLDLDALSQWGDIGRMAGNDFESPVFGHHPEIRAAFEALVGTHPLVCRMSGSGSTLAAVYRSERDRDDARMMLGRRHGALVATETMAAVATPTAAVMESG